MIYDILSDHFISTETVFVKTVLDKSLDCSEYLGVSDFQYFVSFSFYDKF